MAKRQRGDENKDNLSNQVEEKVNNPDKSKPTFKPNKGNTEIVASTGSTLLDLAISGGRIKGGGIPAGILMEVFGPSSSGKTVILSEIAGYVQKILAGEVMFGDPEGRLNKQFAKLFNLDVDNIDYSNPKRVPEVFSKVWNWEPENTNTINGVFTDSLAALSTDLEMGSEEGDKMGMRRAREFSEWLRKTCIHIKEKNMIMVCSNQIRETTNQFGPKYKSPGGMAIEFYSSVRLNMGNPQKITREKETRGKTAKRVIGIETEVTVDKNSVWKPFRSAPIYIYFDYGIDDIRANLQFIKDYTEKTTYTLDNKKLYNSMDKSIEYIENNNLEYELKEEVINLWEEIESMFESNRKPKKR